MFFVVVFTQYKTFFFNYILVMKAEVLKIENLQFDVFEVFKFLFIYIKYLILNILYFFLQNLV